MTVRPPLYVEVGLETDPRVEALVARLRPSAVVACSHYGEVFNRRAQDFRLQKRAPSWIVANKRGAFTHPVPAGFGVGGAENYYFSHMLNCLYDCSYCFLQGMFTSANYVWFVNYGDFMAAIDERLAASGEEAVWFFSGYDGDSMAFDQLTGFCDTFLPFFAERPRAWLELRTKSVEIGALLGSSPLPNCVVAFSMTPQEEHAATERQVPSIERRLDAMQRLGERGWKLGLRLDPLLWSPDHEERYRRLLDQVFARLDGLELHSVSLGGFRLPTRFFQRMVRLAPTDPLLAGPLERRDDSVGYQEDLECELIESTRDLLTAYVPNDRVFLAGSPVVTANQSAITDAQ